MYVSIDEIIGLIGTSFLCTFGSPYKTPGFEPTGLISLYVFSSILFWSRRFLRYCVSFCALVMVRSSSMHSNFVLSSKSFINLLTYKLESWITTALPLSALLMTIELSLERFTKALISSLLRLFSDLLLSSTNSNMNDLSSCRKTCFSSIIKSLDKLLGQIGILFNVWANSSKLTKIS